MAWWTAVPSLTPLVAHDALRVSATHFLDGVGVNHMGLGGCAPKSDYPVVSYSGGGVPLPYSTPIVLPGNAVLFALRKAFSGHVTFYETGTTSYIMGQEPEGQIYTFNGADALLASAGQVPFASFGFTALVKGASTSRLYHNAVYVGGSVPNANVMPSVGGVGYPASAAACFDTNDSLGAFGIFSGTPTLAELQALEAAVRAELAAPQPNTNVLSFAPLASSAGTQAIGAPSTQVVDVGQVRVRLSAGFAGLGSIEGVVTVNNVPAAKQVRLFDKATGLLVATTQSAVDGTYAFTGIDASREYFVVSHDNSRAYNAVISDMIAP